MKAQPSNLRIAGVALLLFSATLLGVGMHHLVATGTCSSTGYSGDYGPVPTCPSGTGWWMAFLFVGIFGCLAGAGMAASGGLVFAGIFGGIGIGALSLLLDSSAHSSTKIFGGIFGGCFALVGVIAGGFVLSGAISSLRSAAGRRSAAGSSPGSPSPSASAPKSSDPILGAYEASRTDTVSPIPAAPLVVPATGTTAISSVPSVSPANAGSAGARSIASPLSLIPGLQAVAQQASSEAAVDRLAKLAELHKSGALSDAEFEQAKAKLLGQM